MNYTTALISGASSGIGQAFAEQLAAAGSDLILVARSKDRLDAIAARLRKEHGRRIEVIAADLGKPAPGAALAEQVRERGMSVDLLINNAGFGAASSFHLHDAARDQQMVALNIGAVVDLTHAFLPAMVEAGRGAVINIASMAAFQPTPFMSVYGASKAFVLSFTEGLWAEYRRRGVRFLAVCPGPVDTGFFEATGNDKLRGSVPASTLMKPAAVVKQSLKALRGGKMIVIPGALNPLVAALPRVLPRKAVAATVALMMKR